MARFFRRSKKKEQPGTSLPADFERSTEQLERTMLTSPTLTTLRCLLEQYVTAIGCLEAAKDSKYALYQQKMQALLACEDYQKLMEPQPALSDPALSSTDSLTTEESNPEAHPESLDSLHQQRDAERILSEDQSVSRGTAEKVQRDLKHMHAKLSVKIEERKSRQSLRKSRTLSEEPTPPKQHKRKFFKPNCELPVTVEEKEEVATRLSNSSNAPEGECDKSGGLPKRMSLDTFEAELEKVMEAFVIEKVSKTQEIRHRYETQVAELRSEGENAFMRQVIDQVRREEEREVKTIVETLEEKRKEDIQKLRALYLQ